jgi:CRISPR-associated protein Cmr4
MTTHLTFIHALSPLHAGTGQGVDLIDLPIARERATNLPFLPGSSLKGTLRDRARGMSLDDKLQHALFGPPTTTNDDQGFAGSVQFSDQRLLLLPVRSMAGTFAWLTCPYVLRRLRRDAADAGDTSAPDEMPVPPNTEHCYVTQRSALGVDDKVILEDLDLTHAPGADAWAAWIGAHAFKDNEWQTLLNERLCIVHDDLFGFLAETATEINARIRLEPDKKTVMTGALWYEEALPTESVLWGLLSVEPTKHARGLLGDQLILTLLDALMQTAVQLGGKATVGRGLCQLRIADGQQNGGAA